MKAILFPADIAGHGNGAAANIANVLNPFGEAIPRLFEAGECGGIWGFLYISGANLTECFVGGRIAGREAAKLQAWDG